MNLKWQRQRIKTSCGKYIIDVSVKERMTVTIPKQALKKTKAGISENRSPVKTF